MNTLHAYGLLFEWQFHRTKRFLPMIVMIQVALALGIVWGLAFLIPNIDPRTAMYLSTGAPTLSLLIMGFTVVPQETSQSKLTGRFEYLTSLPIPRLATLVTDVGFWLLAQLPGTVLAVIVASWRFGFRLDVGWVVVPAVLLIALTASCVGNALAMVLQPQVANQLSSFISIGILLFSPINFPAERLPGALAAVHTVLPIRYMAELMRSGLTGGRVGDPSLALTVVAAWCGLGLVVSYRAATRRL